MAIVELKNVRKVYDEKVAVHGLSLTIEPGTIYGVLGPNGSGKTSTIRMMIGITVPDSGTVSLFGQPFTRNNLKRVGYLPEERGLYKKMNVLDQLTFLGQLHRLDAATARARATQWCERLEITEAMPKKTEDLSKGMQQKIQFIAALLHEPDLVIMDEPFSGLDPVNGKLLQDTLMDLRNEGRAILFSTHRMDQAEKMCDEIALVHRGNLVLQGSMREVKRQYPRNRVVIEYEENGSVLRHPSIESSEHFSGRMEIKLKSTPGTDPDAQPLLAAAVANGMRIRRFEVIEPTLEEIFIEVVGGNVDA
ncbi:ABC-2 type transport system ATP-binding protein [Granulicella pectinivorans]|uniref:ABC-2 type transport system ATP-binding protein n=1 Tax=Granulicella pectinivorans TaxID=474950 RepID=A0A1I6N1E5_9BACT|nr:ATP-binding cassette domain-containing protein [Granulicella pectinivorans]SFS21766.1 ABC-2 type transport system ATP-binding protein [Granulicella pectinivorans]